MLKDEIEQTTQDKIEEVCIRELWHPDLFDDLKIDPLDMNKRQALKATAHIIATSLTKIIEEEKGK